MNSGRSFLCCIASSLLCGCVSTQHPNPLPRVTAAENATTIYVIRNKNFVGSAIAANVVCDGWIIAGLYTGRFVKFQADPGSHSVGVAESSHALNLEPKQTYYFLITLGSGGQGFEVERIPETQAKERILQSVELPLQNI